MQNETIEQYLTHRQVNAKSSIKLIDGRYTALTTSVMRIDALPPTVEILCDMQVPLANYYSRKRDIFYRGEYATCKVNNIQCQHASAHYFSYICISICTQFYRYNSIEANR